MSAGVAGLKIGLPANLSEELKALVLMTPYDGASDSVALAARDLFTKHLKNQPNVHSVFFSSEPTDPHESKITGDSDFDFQRFAAAYVSAAIGKVVQYKFGDTVDEQKCLDYMKGPMNSDPWRKLGMYYTLYISLGTVACKASRTAVCVDSAKHLPKATVVCLDLAGLKPKSCAHE